MRFLPLLCIVVGCTFITVFVSATGFFIPNSQIPSDSLATEVALPAAVIAAFSLIAGFLGGREPHRLRRGALDGAITVTVSAGVFLLVMGAFDRHFGAIGGRGLLAYLPVASLAGFGLGAIAGQLRVWIARSA